MLINRCPELSSSLHAARLGWASLSNLLCCFVGLCRCLYNSPFRLVLISVASHHSSTSVAVCLHLAASLTDDSLLAASWRCKLLALNLKETDRDVGGLDDRISPCANENSSKRYTLFLEKGITVTMSMITIKTKRCKAMFRVRTKSVLLIKSASKSKDINTISNYWLLSED